MEITAALNYLKALSVNADNSQMSDGEFRTFVRNSVFDAIGRAASQVDWHTKKHLELSKMAENIASEFSNMAKEIESMP